MAARPISSQRERRKRMYQVRVSQNSNTKWMYLSPKSAGNAPTMEPILRNPLIPHIGDGTTEAPSLSGSKFFLRAASSILSDGTSQLFLGLSRPSSSQSSLSRAPTSCVTSTEESPIEILDFFLIVATEVGRTLRKLY